MISNWGSNEGISRTFAKIGEFPLSSRGIRNLGPQCHATHNGAGAKSRESRKRRNQKTPRRGGVAKTQRSPHCPSLRIFLSARLATKREIGNPSRPRPLIESPTTREKIDEHSWATDDDGVDDRGTGDQRCVCESTHFLRSELANSRKVVERSLPPGGPSGGRRHRRTVHDQDQLPAG